MNYLEKLDIFYSTDFKFSVFKILRRRMELETAKEKKFEIENPV